MKSMTTQKEEIKVITLGENVASNYPITNQGAINEGG